MDEDIQSIELDIQNIRMDDVLYRDNGCSKNNDTRRGSIA